MSEDTRVGDRLLRLRLGNGLGQQELAERAGIAAGSISMAERNLSWLDPRALDAVSAVLDVSPAYFHRPGAEPTFTTPQLRAYADASQRTVDRVLHDSRTAVDAFATLGLRRVPDTLPIFDGDSNDAEEIERAAADVRTLAGVEEGARVGNAVRAAERLGVVMLPMNSELGRHLGMSLRINDVPVIRVSRSSISPEHAVPGDRQRFTVAHELGHLVLHAGRPQPVSAADATKREHEAHRFASAFLAPGDAVINDLGGARVSLTSLTRLKEKWGFSIKAFVTRFRQLGVIDDDHARSLFKQISARRWNKREPIEVDNESAVWLRKMLARGAQPTLERNVSAVSDSVGLGAAYFHRWLDWSPSASPTTEAAVSVLTPRPISRQQPTRPLAPVRRLPARHVASD
ncbi:helix-turn-helix domain-containing protein [Microbacterium aurantiacum]|uniref:HTH cro/C1-type domain-containing protein n=1 Tax=Microbacterium aurantiacum TaxID=162393 RepID=A0A0M9VMG3_9MICO|nr:XRE family transcriptional regulator [Microbacterium chocolatum]ANG84650.1 hypothetical protein A8L33_03950 [Microbacterium chocolatum]KOS12233.1 hypothetical protein XI38_02335 [Microbacterium chocolatum]